MHAISSYRGNRPKQTQEHTHTHTPTNRQDRLQHTVPQLAARSVIIHYINTMFNITSYSASPWLTEDHPTKSELVVSSFTRQQYSSSNKNTNEYESASTEGFIPADTNNLWHKTIQTQLYQTKAGWQHSHLVLNSIYREHNRTTVSQQRTMSTWSFTPFFHTLSNIMNVLSRVPNDVKKYLSSLVQIWIAFGITRAVFSFVTLTMSLQRIVSCQHIINIHKITNNHNYKIEQLMFRMNNWTQKQHNMWNKKEEITKSHTNTKII